jgi:antitoxin (DNA-binding transcriptional repressor) of toxin-antitoxin stability system
MERYDAADRVSVEELISSAESGVEVELTRDGKVVARVVPTPTSTADAELNPTAEQRQATENWLAELRKFRATLPPEILKLGWQATLREVREGRDL